MCYTFLFALSLILTAAVMGAAAQDADEAMLRMHFMRIRAIVLGKFALRNMLVLAVNF